MNRILLLEDDPGLTEGLSYALSKNGFFPDIAGSVQEARSLLFPIHSYDLLLLDVTLPDGTGFGLCSEIQGRGDQTPIIFLTASDEETSVIRGLDSGGDDYITKPFKLGELCSRIRASQKKHAGKPAGRTLLFHAARFRSGPGRLYIRKSVPQWDAAGADRDGIPADLPVSPQSVQDPDQRPDPR